jgi:hypothetical protein
MVGTKASGGAVGLGTPDLFQTGIEAPPSRRPVEVWMDDTSFRFHFLSA